MSEKPWDGRFSEKTDTSVEEFTSSIDVDKRLYSHDIEGSIAHLKMLAKASIITEDESLSLIQGLGVIKREIERDKFVFHDSLEDIHMHIEARLAQDYTKIAQKLHTARSRNDQVVLDARMYLRDAVKRIIEQLVDLRQVILTLAREHLDVIMPGYTHLQRAQPVLFSHHLLAYYEMFLRDTKRFTDGLQRIDVNPLGSAALAGTTYPIDRAYTSELLNFPKTSVNSIDAVSDRDFMMEFLSSASICMVHFSRMSEELILWSSSEFDFVVLPDAFATGSSIMPQKKNPDIPELVRGKTGRVFGNLITLLTIMKSLPLSYNRDMQEDKEPLFDTIDTLTACISIYIKMLPNISVQKEKMLEATTTGFLNATDMADYLVTMGMPFREAHSVVGRAVGYALDKRKELHELGLEELKKLSSLFKEDIFDFLDTRTIIDRRTSYGGTALENVKAELIKAEKEVKKEKAGL